MHRRFRAEIVTALSEAPHWKCVSFMAYCCESMLANYRLYRRQYNRGNVRTLRCALDNVWDWARVDDPTPFSDEAIETVYKVSPARIRVQDLSPLEEAAYGTVSAIAFCMEFGRTGVEDVCDVALSCVISGSGIHVHDFHVQQLDPDQWLHWEMQRQRDCLNRLLSADDTSKEEIILMLRQQGATAQPSILSAAQIDALRAGDDVCAT